MAYKELTFTTAQKMKVGGQGTVNVDRVSVRSHQVCRRENGSNVWLNAHYNDASGNPQVHPFPGAHKIRNRPTNSGTETTNGNPRFISAGNHYDDLMVLSVAGSLGMEDDASTLQNLIDQGYLDAGNIADAPE